MTTKTNPKKTVYLINGGYVVVDTYPQGFKIASAICAYEGAEDEAYEFCDRENLPISFIDLVCGWDAADERLRSWGIDPDTYVFEAA